MLVLQCRVASLRGAGEPAPCAGAKYALNLTHWPFKSPGRAVFLRSSFLQLPFRTFPSFLFSYFCHNLYSPPLLSLAFRPPPVHTRTQVMLKLALARQHWTVWVCSVSTQSLFIVGLCFTLQCPIKHSPANKSPRKWTVAVKASPGCCCSCNYVARRRVLTSHKPSHPRLYFSNQPSRITFHHLSGTYKNSHRRRRRRRRTTHRLLPSYLFISPPASQLRCICLKAP